MKRDEVPALSKYLSKSILQEFILSVTMQFVEAGGSL